ncbi:hypothetical protein M885DRAFT_541599 [Pelagophyceae sp. CCMP2097]|nr:hypothetical protein M885DRAFT_541599 [Pelagophyceae sp. CCMP2097]
MRVHVPLESVGVVRGVGQPLIPETCEFELRDFLHREHPRREREIRDRLGEDAARVCEQLVAVVADEHLVEGLDLDVQLVQHLAEALRHGAEHDRGVGLDDSESLPRALLRREGVDQEFADGLQGHPQRLDLLADLPEKLFSPREGLRRIPTETHARRRRRRRILQPFDFQRRRRVLLAAHLQENHLGVWNFRTNSNGVSGTHFLRRNRRQLAVHALGRNEVVDLLRLGVCERAWRVGALVLEHLLRLLENCAPPRHPSHQRVSLLVGAAGADEGLHAALAPPFSLPRQPVLVLHPLHQNDIASSAAPVLARDRQRDNAARVDFAIAVVDAGHRVRPII